MRVGVRLRLRVRVRVRGRVRDPNPTPNASKALLAPLRDALLPGLKAAAKAGALGGVAPSKLADAVNPSTVPADPNPNPNPSPSPSPNPNPTPSPYP